MSFDEKFEKFWILINKSEYKFSQEMKEFMEVQMKASGFCDKNENFLTTQDNIRVKKPKIKKLSGYNLFVAEKIPEVKVQGIPNVKRMSEISKLWKQMTDEEKDEWKIKAKETLLSTETNNHDDQLIQKKLTGYNLFVTDKVAELKTQGISGDQRIPQAVQLWKNLSREEKSRWKNQVNGSNVPVHNKKLTGYNLYMKEETAKLRALNIPGDQYMTQISSTWKNLSVEEKNGWKERATMLGNN
jgi:hypothetical protein